MPRSALIKVRGRKQNELSSVRDRWRRDGRAQASYRI